MIGQETFEKFSPYTSLQGIKHLLKDEGANLFNTQVETSFSGHSPVLNSAVVLRRMLPAELMDGGKNLNINYSFDDTPFGKIIIADTPKGICHLAFCEMETEGLLGLEKAFANAEFIKKSTSIQQDAVTIIQQYPTQAKQISLHLKGTDFQIGVWEALLKIPVGKLSTYGSLAKEIEKPSAARAVGTAIGSNTIAVLIPCHRVIQQSGNLGGYRWGNTRKRVLIAWERTALENSKFHR